MLVMGRPEGFEITYDVEDIAVPLGGGGKGSGGSLELAQAQGASGARNGEEFRGHCWWRGGGEFGLG